MKKMFAGYYRPTDDEFKKAWETGTFSFDTNVLLNLYRYTQETRSSLLKVLDHVKARSWLPHQVGQEYFNRRADVIAGQLTIYDQLVAIITKVVEEIEKKYKRSTQFHEAGLAHLVKQGLNRVKEDIETRKKQQPDLLANDTVLDQL